MHTDALALDYTFPAFISESLKINGIFKRLKRKEKI
jgi:hypothetical protein